MLNFCHNSIFEKKETTDMEQSQHTEPELNERKNIKKKKNQNFCIQAEKIIHERLGENIIKPFLPINIQPAVMYL